ncbi:MAG: hypothetical protein PHP85_05385 [Gallionella sp.]|nr:hypothetical protein [Gallionella sp.]
MLTKLFGKKCDHPMANLKAAQALLADLPKNDSFKSVVDLTDWIETAPICRDCQLADQFSVVSLLDETVQPCARKLACEYFSLSDVHTFQGNRLRALLANLYRQIAQAYYLLFDRYCNDVKKGGAIRAQLPTVVARAVYAMREHLKYAAANYELHDDEIWRNLARFYQHAAQQGYLDTPLTLYPALSAADSVKCECAKLLAWFACDLNSLNPRGMHLMERIVAQYGSYIELSGNISNKSLFGFDLNHPQGLVRVNVGVIEHPMMIYVSLVGMQEKLEALIKSLNKNIVPKELDLGGVYTVECVLDAAQHVLTYLLDPPLRQSKRSEFKSVLNVVTGYENAFWRCKYIGQESAEYPSVQWTVENASASGFNAVLPDKKIESVHIGHLLGVQTAGVPRLGVAVVRRMSRDAEGHMHVGAEILTHRASEVVLYQGGGEQPALWLQPRVAAENGLVRLLMRADTFSMQHSLKTNFEGKDYLLIPYELQGRFSDCDLACFRAVEQEA